MKMAKTFFLMAAALALMVLIAPVYAATTDSDIEEAAKNSYTFKNYLKDDDVEIEVKDGVVTLTGTVADETRKALAGDTVANLPAVKRVENNLVFNAESSPDLWLKTKVKTTLLFHRHVSATTDVDVNDGIVTLRGEADNQAQKELTGEYTLAIDGVKSVNNEMTVSTTTEQPPQSPDPASGYMSVGAGTTGDRSADAGAPGDRSVGDTIDDASITAQVKMTLLSNRSTSGFQTNVTTRDGVVTLDGDVSTADDKALATKLAGDVRGVRSVDNNMTVNGK